MYFILRTSLSLLLVASCSLFQNDSSSEVGELLSKYRSLQNKDYIDHLTSLESVYIASPGVDSIKLSRRNTRYLRGLYEKIVMSNEFLFKHKQDPRFYIIQDKRPFFFSLPGAQFFFSSGLIVEYFKNEETLVCVLVYEMIKSHYLIYEKKTIIPIGYIKTARLLGLTGIPLEVKMEINKRSYFAMKRAKYDPLAILHWIQVQNRNSLDFSFQHGDIGTLSKEEFQFKNFMVTRGSHTGNIVLRSGRSSSGFYYLIDRIKNI